MVLAIREYKVEQCNIAVIPILGEIVSYAQGEMKSTTPDEVLAQLRQAEKNPDILGVLASIDSSGGQPAAGEAITNGFKHASKPVVAQIGDMGLSAAYMIATGAKTIIASRFSDVGAIGITMSYLEKSEKNTKDGLKYVSLSSAEFKDHGTEHKPLAPRERVFIERNLKDWHDHFTELVSENRRLPLEQVKKLANGSSLSGSLAMENKLIDQLGDKETARVWFAKTLKIAPRDVVFCKE